MKPLDMAERKHPEPTPAATACTRLSQHKRVRGSRCLPLAEELLAVDGGWERKGEFSSRG